MTTNLNDAIAASTSQSFSRDTDAMVSPGREPVFAHQTPEGFVPGHDDAASVTSKVSASTCHDHLMATDLNASSTNISVSKTSDTHGVPVSTLSGGPYPDPTPQPTQDAGSGITFDFNFGVRVRVPHGNWHVIIRDRHTQSAVVEAVMSDATVISEKRYFLDAQIEVRDSITGEMSLLHNYDARDRNVAILLPIGTLGDAIGWFPYAVRFQEVHQCRLHVVVSEPIKALFQPCYPQINFVTRDAFEGIAASLYATYYLGLFFHDDAGHMQPNDFRLVGLHRTAGSILGVSMREAPPEIYLGEAGDTRPIAEPYVVVAAQSSAQCKMWNYPGGWNDVVAFLKTQNYRVICIDREDVTSADRYLNTIPLGAEDQTGDRPLSERGRWLKHAAFFVGLSSGLSWLAWAARTPVVMISGFTHPSNEFTTPYRVFNHNVCNSCWHDVRTPFKHDDHSFCPRHKGTDRQFECTTKITPSLVIDTIKRVINDTRNRRNTAIPGEITYPESQKVDNPFL